MYLSILSVLFLVYLFDWCIFGYYLLLICDVTDLDCLSIEFMTAPHSAGHIYDSTRWELCCLCGRVESERPAKWED